MVAILVSKRIESFRPSWIPKRDRSQEATSWVYQSKEWKALSLAYRRAHPICEADDCTEPVAEVHHKKPLKEAIELAFVWDNLKSLCRKHHAKAHRRGDE